MIESIKNVLKEAFIGCIGLPANKVIRIYVDEHGVFNIIDEDKNIPAANEFLGVPARVIASFAAIPEEKYMKYWRIRMGGYGEFTKEDYNDVVDHLLADYLKEHEEHARRALQNYLDFIESGKPDYNMYVLSLETKDKSWVEFYSNREKALARAEYYLNNDLKILDQKTKSFDLPISFVNGDVITKGEFEVKHGAAHYDRLVLIHRNGKLAVSYENKEHDTYALKVRPYEVNSGERYNVFDVLSGAE